MNNRIQKRDPNSGQDCDI